jgi:hypothetical protein
MTYEVHDLTSESVLKLSEELYAYVPEDRMNLDFTQIKYKHIDPFAMLLAGSIIRRYRERYSKIPFYLYGHEDNTYAGTMGFFKYISANINFGKMPGEAPGSNNYIPITPVIVDELQTSEKMRGKNLTISEAIEIEAERLSRIIDRGNNKELHLLLTYLIREIIRNTPEHAQCNTVWICGQFWPSLHAAEIAILDEGIGIYKSITQNPTYKKYITDNVTALQWAVKAGISEAFSPSQRPVSDDEWANSGFGLYMVSNICKNLKGNFVLASENNFIKIANEYDEPYTGETLFNGTAIQIRINTEDIKDAQQIISTISKQGQEEAKTMRHAFKKASKPSKGLMINL